MQQGKRLGQAWEAQRGVFGKAFLGWVNAANDSESVTEITDRLSAAIEFTMFVAREFLINNYSVEKHESDVYDQFQLHYLAIDRFVMASGDPDLSKRTSRSPQAARILSFQQFLTESLSLEHVGRCFQLLGLAREPLRRGQVV